MASFGIEWSRTTELKQMLGSGRYLIFPDELRDSSLSPSDRKDKKNHTNKLRELALLIPVTMTTRNKKHTKKEILLRVLHYIHYLQRCIDVVQALLKLHSSDSKGGSVGKQFHLQHALLVVRETDRPSAVFSFLREVSTAERAGSEPICRPNPADTPLPPAIRSRTFGAPAPDLERRSSPECQRPTWPQKPRRSLALNQPENLVTAYPGQKEENREGDTYPRDFSPGTHPTSALSLSESDGGGAQLVYLDMAQNIVAYDIISDYGAGTQDGELDTDIKAQSRDQRSCFLTKAEPYLSETHKETPDTDPWLPAWTSEDSPNGSPLVSESSQSNTWHVTNYLSEILGLSSSLFSSPSKILPDHVLEDETYFLTEGLLEPLPAACELEDPQEKVQDTPTAPPNFQSSVSLDHCYLSLSENTKVLSSCSSSSESTDTESLWGQEQANPVGLQTPSDEDRDYTWTPTRQSSGLPVAGKKTKKVQASQGSGKLKESRKACPGQVKKKCVNGFIMFCRMNRKHYIRACPGTASTAATKDLAQLWREMTLEERRPYCTKARRFSRQHNRIVKRESSSSEDDDGETPKPFYQLLADRTQVPLALALLLSPHCQ